MKFTNERVIRASREAVWQAFDNTENLKKWQPTLQQFEHQSGELGQPGAVSKLVYDENGRTVSLIETITARNKPASFSGTYDNSTVFNAITNRFEALDNNRTKWIMETEYRFKGLFRLMAPFVKGSIQKRSNEDMDRFVALVEQSSA
ncbi:SRPBCC family protein [Candidatus Leptofilum sp.]|uniref:SRPBCC family protein n=1 Tax=Candidatus Leptofilum sp. TaxID=3241576 RepID=UPI003B5BEC08